MEAATPLEAVTNETPAEPKKRIDRNGENLFRSLLLAQKAALLSADPAQAETAARLFEQATDTANRQHALAWVQRIAAWRAAARV